MRPKINFKCFAVCYIVMMFINVASFGFILTVASMTKYFLFLICFSFLASCDEDDPRLGTWKQLNDFPFEGRGYGLSFSLLGKGYLVSGETVEHQFKDVWCYDPASGFMDSEK